MKRYSPCLITPPGGMNQAVGVGRLYASQGPQVAMTINPQGEYIKADDVRELVASAREAMRCPHACIDCSTCKRHFARLQRAIEAVEVKA